MQTREPRKRVNWIFVVVLIIVIPLIVFFLIMFNTVDEEAREDVNPGQNQEQQMESPENRNN